MLQLRKAVGNSLIPQTRGHMLNLDELKTGAQSQLNCRVMSDFCLSSLYIFRHTHQSAVRMYHTFLTNKFPD